MLGLGDCWIVAAMVGCVLITVVCVVFGALTWNAGGEEKK